MLRPTLCVTGPEAAELFYDRNRFVRQGAAPWWLRMTLFGPQLVLSGALRLLLTRTVGEWAGIPLPRGTTDRRTRELTALYADAVPLGTRHGRAYLARFSLERWLGALIQRARTGALRPPEQSALVTIAWHWDPSGELLPPRVWRPWNCSTSSARSSRCRSTSRSSRTHYANTRSHPVEHRPVLRRLMHLVHRDVRVFSATRMATGLRSCIAATGSSTGSLLRTETSVVSGRYGPPSAAARRVAAPPDAPTTMVGYCWVT
ncbi:hypothetical protein [Haloechinothrix salitolerans]